MQENPQVLRRVSVKAALIAVFTGLSLGTDYAMFGASNVKLMDSLNFTATYLFGLSVGLPATILTRTVYATINPLGAAPVLLLPTLVLGDCFYVLAAILARKFQLVERKQGLLERRLTLGLLGLFSTLGFDILTNFQSGLVARTGSDLQSYLWNAFLYGLVTMNFPLPMGVLHEASNFLFFSSVAPTAILIINRFPALNLKPLTRLGGRRSRTRTQSS